MMYFSQFNNNTRSHTTGICHNLISQTETTLIPTYFILHHIPNLHIQLVQNAPDDGPVRSETCRANVSADYNLFIETILCILLDYIYIYIYMYILPLTLNHL
jgi:hypothetical protein